jgi:transposase
MPYFNEKHKYYCGIDLHTQIMYIVVRDSDNQTLTEVNVAATPAALEKAVKPYMEDIVIGVECTFSWYWVSDWCQENNVTFVLGHALYMDSIHQAKKKNDKEDARKLANMLYSKSFPTAYAYPKKMRAIRDLLRRRTKFMHDRAKLYGHIKILGHQVNNSFGSLRLNYKYNRKDLELTFEDLNFRLNCEADIKMSEALDSTISKMEQHIGRETQHYLPKELSVVRSIPGIGNIIGLLIVLEIGDINRFDTVQQFSSYCRLVKCAHESAGKKHGHGNKKIGNAYLKWAFSEAACLLIKSSEKAKKFKARAERRHGSAKALSLLAHRIGRCVFAMLKKEMVFDEDKCFGR